MTCSRSLVLLASLLFAAFVGHAQAAPPPLKIFAFGDSLTDNGNNPASSKYYQGRWSNGPVWAEDLAQTYHATLVDRAVAGSVSSDLASQIASVPAGTDLSQALCLVWSGGNDVIDNLLASPSAQAQAGQNVITNVAAAVQTLYARGARSIIVVNVADIGKIPGANQYATPAQAAAVSSGVNTLNQGLKAAVDSVRNASPGLLLAELDAFSLMDNLLAHSSTYGFTVTDIGALDDSNLSDKSFSGPGANYLFWDILHPTAKAHALIANAAIAAEAFAQKLIATAGNYYAVISQQGNTVGYVQLSLNRSGQLSGRLLVNGIAFPLLGSLDANLAYSVTSAASATTLTLSLDTDMNGLPRLSGGITTPNGSYIIAPSVVVATAPVANAPAGQYNILLPGKSVGSSPRGMGWCGLTLSSAGVITGLARLPDGTVTSFGTALRADRTAVFGSVVYGTGTLLATLDFGPSGTNDVMGSYTVVRPPSSPATAPFSAGFSFTQTLNGERYVPPTTGLPLSFSTSPATGDLSLSDGGLASPVTQGMTISTSGAASPIAPANFDASFQLFRANGYWFGSVKPPNGAASGFDGLVLPRANKAAGLFGGASQSGTVQFTPR